MRNYDRVMLGKGIMYADVCRQQGFIGAHFGIDQDLTTFLCGEQRQFTQQIRPTNWFLTCTRYLGAAMPGTERRSRVKRRSRFIASSQVLRVIHGTCLVSAAVLRLLRQDITSPIA